MLSRLFLHWVSPLRKHRGLSEVIESVHSLRGRFAYRLFSFWVRLTHSDMIELYYYYTESNLVATKCKLEEIICCNSFDDCKHSTKMIFFRTNFDPIQ